MEESCLFWETGERLHRWRDQCWARCGLSLAAGRGSTALWRSTSVLLQANFNVKSATCSQFQVLHSAVTTSIHPWQSPSMCSLLLAYSTSQPSKVIDAQDPHRCPCTESSFAELSTSALCPISRCGGAPQNTVKQVRGSISHAISSLPFPKEKLC